MNLHHLATKQTKKELMELGDASTPAIRRSDGMKSGALVCAG